MAGPLAYYQQRFAQVANTPNPLEGLFSAVGSGLQGYMQGVEDKRLREAAAAKAKRQEIEDAQADYKFLRGLGKDAAEGKAPVATLEAYQQAMKPLAGKLGLPVGPEIVGKPMEAYDWETKQQLVDKETPQAHGLLSQFLGAEPKLPTLKSFNTTDNVYSIDPRTGKQTLVQKGQPKPSTSVTYGNPYTDDSGNAVQRGSNGRVVNVGGRGSGGLTQNARDYAGYLTERYGVKFGKGSLYRPAGTVPGETGVHSTGVAIDVPEDPSSERGQAIIADAHAAGYYTYTKPHGTGPHIHIETNRNPDGSMKTGGRGSSKSSSKPIAENPEAINKVQTTISNLRASIAKRFTRTDMMGKQVTDWNKVDAEWRPKATKILQQRGLDPALYLPDMPSEPQGAAPSGMPLSPEYLRSQGKAVGQKPAAQGGGWLGSYANPSEAADAILARYLDGAMG